MATWSWAVSFFVASDRLCFSDVKRFVKVSAVMSDRSPCTLGRVFLDVACFVPHDHKHRREDYPYYACRQ